MLQRFALTFLLSSCICLHAQIVSVTDMGALSNGTNAAATTSAFLKAFAAAPTGKVIVPPGAYLLDNSKAPVTITNFGGEFKFEGLARLVFTAPQKSGIVFNGGSAARILGLRAGYQTLPATMVTGVATVSVVNTTNTFLDQITIENSPGAGLYVYNSLEPKVSNAATWSSLAEGFRFDDSRSVELANISVINSGSDGVALWRSSTSSDRDGGLLSNISVRNAVRRGISITGTSSVTVTSFTVDVSGSSGIYCASDTGSAVPNHVIFQGGVIEGTGGFGAEAKNPGSCTFTNLDIFNTRDRGLTATAPTGTIVVQGVRVLNNLTNDSFWFQGINQVRVSESSAENSPGYGFMFDTCTQVLVSGLKTQNVSIANSLHRTIWFQNGGTVTATDLTITDTQGAATGYITGTSNMQKGIIHSVASGLYNGQLSVINYSPAVKIMMVY
jgi:hypothetical protein